MQTSGLLDPNEHVHLYVKATCTVNIMSLCTLNTHVHTLAYSPDSKTLHSAEYYSGFLCPNIIPPSRLIYLAWTHKHKCDPAYLDLFV